MSMKKFLNANWVLAAASLFCLSTLVACGASNNNTAPLLPIAGGLGTYGVPCPYGQVNMGTGCVPITGGSVLSMCYGTGLSITTASDGTQVCRIAASVSEVAGGNGTDYLGPSGGGGITAGQLMPGDSVLVNASGSWGTNTCTFNFCWGSSCTCSCSGGASSTDPLTGLYLLAGGTALPVQPSASFQVGAAPTSLVVGFNAPSMKCFNLNLNVQITRCIDASGLTHPCH